ncbi:hypothetical protein [Psychromonas hadalis]|uniref:hypothetical protein n=1 Tax=Psychromonas hadalis TaxID=211669 RepID=UPI0003B64B27|nr:hypothetical protein [Psychromonas hadalis]
MIKHLFGIMLLFSFFVSPAVYADTITRSQVPELMVECKSYRQAKIAPLRQAEIEKCVEKGKELDRCESFNETFGETRYEYNRLQIGLFWGDDICDKALKSEKYFRANPSSKEYSW